MRDGRDEGPAPGWLGKREDNIGVQVRAALHKRDIRLLPGVQEDLLNVELSSEHDGFLSGYGIGWQAGLSLALDRLTRLFGVVSQDPGMKSVARALDSLMLMLDDDIRAAD